MREPQPVAYVNRTRRSARSGTSLRRTAAAAACAILLAAAAGIAEAATPAKDKYAPKVNKKPKTIAVTRDGDGLCFGTALRFGTIAIAGGCYTFYVVHSMDGTFLGFGPGGASMIPPGQLVRLNTPAGAKHKGRLAYNLPVPAEYVALPLGSMQHVRVNFSVQNATSTVLLRVPRTSGVTTGREFEVPLVR
jgi:hypothetical protein